MNKLILTLLSFIWLLLLFSGQAYANTDYMISTSPEYSCVNWVWTLKLVFGSTRHHVDTRYYRIDHAGYISLWDAARTSILRAWNWYIPWCGCPTPNSSIRNIAPSNGIQQKSSSSEPDFRWHGGPGWYLNWWPYRSGSYPAEVGPWNTINFVNTNQEATAHTLHYGTYQTAWFWNTTAVITFYPVGNWVVNPSCYPPSCDSTVANTTLRTAPLDSTGAKCSDGSPANFVSTTDATGKTTYTWKCQKTGTTAATCNAYYKPLCIPTATDGCCGETRANPNAWSDLTKRTDLPQCRYSALLNNTTYALSGWVMPTQTWPVTLGINSTTNCRPPVDGKPRIICDSDPFSTIVGTLTSFTLPSTVTQKIGRCTIKFDAADVCIPRTTDTVDLKAYPCDITITNPSSPLYCKWNACDPSISDSRHPFYCLREVITDNVCTKLTDGFGNPVYNYATNKITSVLWKVISNEYHSNYNGTGDATIYASWAVTVVGNQYCEAICTMVGTTKCCPWSTNPICNPTIPTPCDPTITDKTNARYCKPNPTCVKTATESCCIPTVANNYCGTSSVCDPTITNKTQIWYCCDSAITDKNNPRYCEVVTPSPTCTPTKDNNYCNPIGEVETQPGCGDSTAKCITIPKKKACTWYLEVWNGTTWTRDGESILYDEPNAYRVVITDADPICRGGLISIQKISGTGWTLTGNITYGQNGIFRTTVTKTSTDTPTTQRWITVSALFTQPGWLTYFLTESPYDFSNTPLSITGNRMKWVRIIGNSAGTTITNFNLNNAWVIGEQTGPAAVTARNAMIKNAALLTRWMVPNGEKSINDIYYAEGDFNYSSLSGKEFKTLILKGNLTIDTNIPDGSNKWIIVLAKDTGVDGNIIVWDSVTFIHALVFAEGTFRGASKFADALNPKIQLVLKGSLFSRNTVWWSATIQNLYLAWWAKTTDRDAAFRQDLNTVRNGNGNATYKNYKDPFVIDFDNMQSAPPPGFTISL